MHLLYYHHSLCEIQCPGADVGGGGGGQGSQCPSPLQNFFIYMLSIATINSMKISMMFNHY